MRIFARNMMKIGTVGLVFIAGLLMEAAHGQGRESSGCKNPQLKPSSFNLWVRPNYPEAALAAGLSGVVEVQANVDERGRASALKYSSESGSASFEEAVRAVAEHWRYLVPISTACAPMKSAVHARIHFRLEDGRAAVSLEEVPSATGGSTCMDAARVLNDREVSEKMEFPMIARRTQSEGTVYLAITFGAASGEVKDVEVVQLVEGGDAKREFRNAALIAYRSLRVEPRAGAGVDETVRICRWINFELKR